MLPNFVVIGAQKSASTFIQECISEHPQVWMPSGEIPIFESPDYEKYGISALQQLFKGKKEEKLGIKRPNYIGKPEVPERIKRHLPEARLIAVLRNPIERAVSAYYHYINYGFIPAIDIEKGMRSILDGAYKDKFKRAHEIIEFGFYYKYLKKYQYFFKKGQILIVFHEEILADKLASIQRVYSFLDLDKEYIPKATESRPQAATYNITRLKLLSMRNLLIYGYNSDRTRLFVKKRNLIGKAIAGLITIIDQMLIAQYFGSKRTTLSKDIEKRLYIVYEEDIHNLQSYIARDLTNWKPY